MRICTVQADKLEPFFGVELGKRVLRIAKAAELLGHKPEDVAKVSTALDYFQNLPASEKIVRGLLNKISENPKALAKPASDGHPCLIPAESIVYLPPIMNPSKILCIGLNYKDHCEEQNKEIPKKPLVFNKFQTSLRGHGAEVGLPHKYDKCVDYEAEFAVVIGKRARRVTKRTAMKHVGGYTIVNDLSLRTLQQNEKQWSRAKGWDGSGPCGPVIVTPDEIPDPHALGISCHVNGVQRQKSNTSNLIFPVPELIAYISQLITLEPGDIISTGTPGGVGVYSDPQVFLQEGDVVDVKVDRIGTLRTKLVKG